MLTALDSTLFLAGGNGDTWYQSFLFLRAFLDTSACNLNIKFCSDAFLYLHYLRLGLLCSPNFRFSWPVDGKRRLEGHVAQKQQPHLRLSHWVVRQSLSRGQCYRFTWFKLHAVCCCIAFGATCALHCHCMYRCHEPVYTASRHRDHLSPPLLSVFLHRWKLEWTSCTLKLFFFFCVHFLPARRFACTSLQTKFCVLAFSFLIHKGGMSP